MNQQDQILKKIYSFAIEIQKLAPWQWMYESELFGIQLPDAHSTWFPSIMGSAGQFLAISFYEGEEAAHHFLSIQERASEAKPFDILMIPHIMIAFQDLHSLEQDERNRFNELGYSLSASNKWPVLSQITPGHPPFFPEKQKLHELLTVLEQTLIVVKRAKTEEFAFLSRTREGISGYYRVCETVNGMENWQDAYLTFQPVTVPVNVPYSRNQIQVLNRIPKNNLIVEGVFSLIPNPVSDMIPEYYPFVLLLVERKSGYIIQFEILTPHPNFNEMYSSTGMKFLDALIKKNIHPLEVRANSVRLLQILKKVLAETSIRLSYKKKLPAAEDALESLIHFMSSPKGLN